MPTFQYRALQSNGAIADSLDLRAKRPHRSCGIEYVLAFEQAGNPRASHRQSTKDQGAVGNRLVAGHADTTGQRPAASRRHRGGGRCVVQRTRPTWGAS